MGSSRFELSREVLTVGPKLEDMKIQKQFPVCQHGISRGVVDRLLMEVLLIIRIRTLSLQAHIT